MEKAPAASAPPAEDDKLIEIQHAEPVEATWSLRRPRTRRTLVASVAAAAVAGLIVGVVLGTMGAKAGGDDDGRDLCGNQPVRRVPDNSSLSHFSAMTRPSWLGRAVRNRHRHAIEQLSRRWRGGRRDDSARRRRKILISTQAATTAARSRPRPGRSGLRR